MRKFMQMGAGMLLMAAMALCTTACGDDDDPDYNEVTPPTVAVSNSISGRVTGMDGEGLSATVTMGTTTTSTKADGTFVFEDVKAGTHTLKAEAAGKLPVEGSVTVAGGEKSDNPVWNVALRNVGVEKTVNEDGSAEANVTSETLKGNENGQVTVEVDAPAGALPAGTSLIITPVYSQNDVITKATESVMLIGTILASTDPSATLAKPINLEYDVDAAIAAVVTAKKWVDGQWADATFSVSGSKVTVAADLLTSYALFFDVSVSSSPATEAISFDQATWDNLFGSSEVSVSSASYTYKIGTEISLAASDRATAYLVEVLARRAGAGVATITGSYPIDVTLAVGTALSISGQQATQTWSASAAGKSASAKQYGGVSIAVITYNRNHNGGSN